jgi:TRAP-type mannitol/chloroaromatic compound transport system permease large subunit
MDSRQRFVLVYAGLAMIPFTVFTFLNTTDIGIFVSAYTIEYFALRLIMNPKLKLKVDALGLILLVLFLYFVAVRVASILGVSLL